MDWPTDRCARVLCTTELGYAIVNVKCYEWTRVTICAKMNMRLWTCEIGETQRFAICTWAPPTSRHAPLTSSFRITSLHVFVRGFRTPILLEEKTGGSFRSKPTHASPASFLDSNAWIEMHDMPRPMNNLRPPWVLRGRRAPRPTASSQTSLWRLWRRAPDPTDTSRRSNFRIWWPRVAWRKHRRCFQEQTDLRVSVIISRFQSVSPLCPFLSSFVLKTSQSVCSWSPYHLFRPPLRHLEGAVAGVTIVWPPLRDLP